MVIVESGEYLPDELKAEANKKVEEKKEIAVEEPIEFSILGGKRFKHVAYNDRVVKDTNDNELAFY